MSNKVTPFLIRFVYNHPLIQENAILITVFTGILTMQIFTTIIQSRHITILHIRVLKAKNHYQNNTQRNYTVAYYRSFNNDSANGCFGVVIPGDISETKPTKNSQI
jgi:hypothetical protein